MILLHRLASIMNWILRRRTAETRLDDELESYVEMSAAEKMRDGVPPDQARRMAGLELGGVEQTREQVRAFRHGGGLDEIGRDAKYACRMFARQPVFTGAVLLTLALGIGANTAIFSLLDALTLRVLPVRDPHALVQLNLRERDDHGTGDASLSYPLVRALDDRRDIFDGVGAFGSINTNIGAPGSVREVSGALVSGGYFHTLGLTPAAGRLLSRDDDQKGAPVTAVISDAFWAREYARAESVIGQSIQVNHVAVTIVGVTPSGFTGTEVGANPDITMPIAALPQLIPAFAALLEPGTSWLRALARPAVGVSPAHAATRLNAIWPSIADAVAAPRWTPARRKTEAESVFVFQSGATGWSGLRETYEKPLAVLMAVACLVLAIACANVASLLLARASTRQREVAVRLAIGAGRRRIVRQLLIEGLVLSSAGAVLGLGVAWVSSRFLVNLISTGPIGEVSFDLTPNGHVLMFSTFVALGTGVVFGLAPAFQMRSERPVSALRADDRTSTSRSRVLPSLVALQVALSLVLVAGAGLFVRTLQNLRSLDAGFSASHVFVVNFSQGGAVPDQILAEAQHVPGILSISLATHTPLNGSSWTEAVVPAGQTMPEQDNARIIAATEGFFETLQIPIVSGRAFTDRDTASSSPVAIVSERYAAEFLPGGHSISGRLTTRLMGRPVELEIVGVAKNVNLAGLRNQAPATVYVSYRQFPSSGPGFFSLPPSLIFRTSTAGTSPLAAVRAIVQSRLPESPAEIHPMIEQVNRTIVQERIMATLAAGFAALALTLASIGLYALLAYMVARRSREIGIRMALGESASHVVTLVLVSGARLVGVGLLIGLPAAWAASRAIRSMLFGVTPTDPVTMIGAISVLVVAGLTAAYFPARRAARVDPLVALRHE